VRRAARGVALRSRGSSLLDGRVPQIPRNVRVAVETTNPNLKIRVVVGVKHRRVEAPLRRRAGPRSLRLPARAALQPDMTDALNSKRQKRIARTITSPAMRANVGRRLAEPALLGRPGQTLLAAPAIRVLAAADDAIVEGGRSMSWGPERRGRRPGQRVALRQVRGAT